MAKRLALLTLGLAALAVAAAYGSAFLPGGAPAWAPWTLAVATAAMTVAVMTIGAARGGRIGRLAWPFALVFFLIAGGFGLVLAMPGEAEGAARLWLGLPPRAAVVLYGIGLLPLLAVPLAYALSFDAEALGAEQLARLRAAALAARPDDRAEDVPGGTAARGADRRPDGSR